ncbi:tetratricopeptide repeat protein [Marispirochaeta sp.]|uniref:tetratricopeptide repeat protein n=1 Tax=Marispirochaeta sp. TaxID=2038653 RepID=UPI0029C6E246|nr:tetratricopeptide repeat protein [Marispirochaeta sp.]
MRLPKDRFNFSRVSQNYGRRKSGLKLVVSAIVVILSITIGAFSVNKIMRVSGNDLSMREELKVLWEQMNYEEINLRCAEVLESSPLNMDALVYNGLSYFYRGVAKFTLEDKIPLFDQAIEYLRLADLTAEYPLKGSVHYILAKTYYHKGRYYTDLAINYMLSSLDLGYQGIDSYEYLGLSYSELGEYEKSVEYFEKALDQNPSDTLYLVLGQTYFSMEEFSRAEETLLRCLNATGDIATQQKARFLLGRIYLNRKEYLKAENQYREILAINKNSADSYFYLGSIYDELNDTIKARAEWRKALEIDPTHHGARQKLYN